MTDVLDERFPEIRLLRPKRLGDDRGFFAETFRAKWFPDLAFVQENTSFSAPKGTVRGLHYQLPPAAQAKLVSVVQGAIWDVAVDIRQGSPTFGQWVGVRLAGGDLSQLFIPPGFAHGFCTLEPDTWVAYKVSAYYAPEHERNILWNDPALAIDWPVTEAEATLSGRDQKAPLLAAIDGPFPSEP